MTLFELSAIEPMMLIKVRLLSSRTGGKTIAREHRDDIPLRIEKKG